MPSCVFNRYTAREREILEALCAGLNVREIGLTLGISCNTVKGIMRTLLNKTRTHDQNSLILYVITRDWRGPYLYGYSTLGR